MTKQFRKGMDLGSYVVVGSVGRDTIKTKEKGTGRIRLFDRWTLGDWSHKRRDKPGQE